MKDYKITYLSGQSVIIRGVTLEQVAKKAKSDLAWLKVGRPWIGIASVTEVK
jgi:hypothetical protein